jgi:hypothetical protein
MKEMTEGVPKLRILTIRDQRVLLDADLARLYGVETRALNQAAKRNPDRFPEEFAFTLARDEILRISQTVISLRYIKFSKRVQVFTEHGALQAANVLNSPRAVQMAKKLSTEFKSMRNRPKNSEAARHDALLLRWVDERRRGRDANCRITTLDMTLVAAEREALHIQPRAITLDALLAKRNGSRKDALRLRIRFSGLGSCGGRMKNWKRAKCGESSPPRRKVPQRGILNLSRNILRYFAFA